MIELCWLLSETTGLKVDLAGLDRPDNGGGAIDGLKFKGGAIQMETDRAL